MTVLTPDEAAESLGLSAEYIRRLIRAGKFPGHRRRGKIQIATNDLERWRSGQWTLDRAQEFLDTVPVPESKSDPGFSMTIKIVRKEYAPSPSDLVWLIRNWSRLLFSDDELKKH